MPEPTLPICGDAGRGHVFLTYTTHPADGSPSVTYGGERCVCGAVTRLDPNAPCSAS